MSTIPTKPEHIRRWFDEGVAKGATHMLVVCDTFSYEDYPVYATGRPEEEEGYLRLVTNYQTGKVQMQRLMEVYNLRKPLDAQKFQSTPWGERVFDL